MPLLWTATSYGLMGVVNPVLQQRVDWPWFIVSQFVFGMVAAIVVASRNRFTFRRPGSGPEPTSEFIADTARWRRERRHRQQSAQVSAADQSLAARDALVVVFLAGCQNASARRRRCRSAKLNEIPAGSFEGLLQDELCRLPWPDGQLGPAPPLNDPVFRAIVPDDELLQSVGRAGRERPMPGFSRAARRPADRRAGQRLAEGSSPTGNRAKGRCRRSLPADAAGCASRRRQTSRRGRGTEPETFRPGLRRVPRRGRTRRLGQGAERINDPDFLALISDQALRRIIITGRSDLGMPELRRNRRAGRTIFNR